MPFIEDEWWSAENEGRMVDLSNCLQDAVVAAGGQAAAQLQQMASSLGELSQAELSNIVGGLTLEPDGSEAADPDDILKQLGETAFDNFDTFFTDLTNATASAVPPIEIKQEENNNVTSPASSSQLQSYYQPSGQLILPNNGQQRLQQLLRSGTTAINNAVANNINNGRYNIASANPLLAEKLAATSSGIKQEPISSDYNGTMNYGSASPMQRVPSGKPQVHDAGGGKVDGEPAGLTLGARGSLGRALLHGLLAPAPAARHHLYTAPNTGSLPPSPADSGVSDVESSSSGAGSAEELKARLQPPPPTPFHTPFLPFYPHHQIASSLQHHVAHPRPPVGSVSERDAYAYGYAAAGARRAALRRVRLRRLPAAPPPQQAQAQEAPAQRRAAHARREAQEPRGLHHLPVGVPPQAAAGPRVLPALHQVDQPREGRLQAGRLEGRVAALGAAQEQARHELRDHGPRAPLLLPEGHPGQGGRAAARVPVRGRPEGHRGDRLLAGVGSRREDARGVGGGRAGPVRVSERFLFGSIIESPVDSARRNFLSHVTTYRDRIHFARTLHFSLINSYIRLFFKSCIVFPDRF